eukprot:12499100-Alexandrium_andersonii.AAC.1
MQILVSVNEHCAAVLRLALVAKPLPWHCPGMAQHTWLSLRCPTGGGSGPGDPVARPFRPPPIHGLRKPGSSSRAYSMKH